jgi:hypothetical protein
MFRCYREVKVGSANVVVPSTASALTSTSSANTPSRVSLSGYQLQFAATPNAEADGFFIFAVTDDTVIASTFLASNTPQACADFCTASSGCKGFVFQPAGTGSSCFTLSSLAIASGDSASSLSYAREAGMCNQHWL